MQPAQAWRCERFKAEEAECCNFWRSKFSHILHTKTGIADIKSGGKGREGRGGSFVKSCVNNVGDAGGLQWLPDTSGASPRSTVSSMCAVWICHTRCNISWRPFCHSSIPCTSPLWLLSPKCPSVHSNGKPCSKRSLPYDQP